MDKTTTQKKTHPSLKEIKQDDLFFNVFANTKQLQKYGDLLVYPRTHGSSKI
jgi:hypothetical protein